MCCFVGSLIFFHNFTGELNRSALFCKLNFLNRLGLAQNEYALAVATPGMAQQVNSDAGVVERVQRVPVADFEAAVTGVHGACIQVHGEDKCCMFYHPRVGPALQAGCGPISSIVASPGAIPDLADQGVTGAVRKQQNIERANAITGLNL